MYQEQVDQAEANDKINTITASMKQVATEFRCCSGQAQESGLVPVNHLAIRSCEYSECLGGGKDSMLQTEKQPPTSLSVRTIQTFVDFQLILFLNIPKLLPLFHHFHQSNPIIYDLRQNGKYALTFTPKNIEEIEELASIGRQGKFELCHNHKEIYSQRQLTIKMLFQQIRQQFFREHMILRVGFDRQYRDDSFLQEVRGMFEESGFEVIGSNPDDILVIDNQQASSNVLSSSESQQQNRQFEVIKNITIQMKLLAKLVQGQQQINALIRSIEDIGNAQITSQRCFETNTTSPPYLQQLRLTFQHEQLMAQTIRLINAKGYLPAINFNYQNKNQVTANISALPSIAKPKLTPVSTPNNNDDLRGNWLRKSSPEVVIRKVNLALRKSSLLELQTFWQNGLLSMIQSALENWQVYEESLEYELIQYALLVEYKRRRFSYDVQLYDHLYKQIASLQRKLISFLDLAHICKRYSKQSSKQQYKTGSSQSKNVDKHIESVRCKLEEMREDLEIDKDSITQKILDYYMIQRKLLQKKGEPLLITINNDKKMPLSQLMAERINIEAQLQEYRSIFISLNKMTFLEDQSIMKTNQCSPKQEYFQSIERERLVEHRCLGCAPFFFKDMNIVDQTVSPIPFKVFPSVQRMRDFQLQIKHEVCSMLNGGGGIIMFDCRIMHHIVQVRGIIMTEKEKELYQQKFMSYLDVFEPRFQAKNCVKITYVPMLNSPYQANDCNVLTSYTGNEHVLKQYEQYHKRQYIEGNFVMRVRISPIESTTLFFYKQNNNTQLEYRYQNFGCLTRINGSKIEMRMRSLSKYIKKRMKEHYLSAKMSKKERKLQSKPFSYFDHTCMMPDVGIGRQNLEKVFRGVKSDRNSGWYYASMVTVKKNHHPDIKRLFKKEGVEVRIQPKYDKSGFKSAQNTAIMYHNEKFEKLLKLVNQNNEFTFGGKPLLLINITNYLKLEKRSRVNPYSKDQFRILLEWIRDEFRRETVQLYEFRTGNERQYFIYCESHEMSLYTFYLLNNQHQRTVFKNPLHLDKMSEEERKEKFILLSQSLVAKNQANYQLHISNQESVHRKVYSPSTVYSQALKPQHSFLQETSNTIKRETLCMKGQSEIQPTE